MDPTLLRLLTEAAYEPQAPSVQCELEKLIRRGGSEIVDALQELRRGPRLRYVNFLQESRALASNVDVELEEGTKRATLLFFPFLLRVSQGARQLASPLLCPSLGPISREVAELVEAGLGLESGSTRLAPFMAPLAAMELFGTKQLRALTLDLALIGDSAELSPCVLDPDPDDTGFSTAVLPLVWFCKPGAGLPMSIASQALPKQYAAVKAEIEGCVSKHITQSSGAIVRAAALKPFSVPTSYVFLRRALLAAQLRKVLTLPDLPPDKPPQVLYVFKGDVARIRVQLASGTKELDGKFPEELPDRLYRFVADVVLATSPKAQVRWAK